MLSAPLRSFSISASCSPVSGFGAAAFLAMTVDPPCPSPGRGSASMHPSVVACAASHTSWVQPDTMATIIPRWEWRTFGTHFGGGRGRRSRRRGRPARPTATRPTCWSRPRDASSGHRQDPLRPHGHQAAPRGGRGRARALGAGPQGRVPDARRGCRARHRGAPAAGDQARPRGVHAAAVPRRGGRTERDGPPRRGPQAPGPLHRRRLLVRGLRRDRERQDHPDHRHRVRRMPPPWSRRSARSASTATPTRATRAGWRRSSTASRSATPSSTSGPTRSSSRSPSSAATGGSTPSSIAPRSPASARGSTRAARSSPRRSSGPIVAIAGMADEAKALGVTATAAVGTAGLRAAGNREAVLDADQGPHRRRDPGHPRRGGGPARLRGRGGRAGLDRGEPRRLRHRRRQLAVHLRPRRPRRRAVQRPGRGRAVHRAVRAGRCGVEGGPRRGARGDRRGPVQPRRPAATRRPRRDGRRHHQHHRGQARDGRLRPDRSSRARSWTAPSWTARSSGTGCSTPTDDARSWASSRSAPR